MSKGKSKEKGERELKWRWWWWGWGWGWVLIFLPQSTTHNRSKILPKKDPELDTTISKRVTTCLDCESEVPPFPHTKSVLLISPDCWSRAF